MNDQQTRQDERRWWWIPVSGGVAASAAVAAIGIVPFTGAAAVPVPVDGSGSGAVAADTGQSPADYDRPCFMVRPHWNNAEGPQPRCPDPASTADPGRARAPVAACPPVPDARYVASPWYAEIPGCPRITYWWRHVGVSG